MATATEERPSVYVFLGQTGYLVPSPKRQHNVYPHLKCRMPVEQTSEAKLVQGVSVTEAMVVGWIYKERREPRRIPCTHWFCL